jgi:hypothetical protein
LRWEMAWRWIWTGRQHNEDAGGVDEQHMIQKTRSV